MDQARTARLFATLFATLCATLCAVFLACGRAFAEGELTAELELRVHQLALAATRAGVPGVSRVEVVVGTLDSRLRLAPCQRIEPYLPPSTRLWGRSRIGLRCADGAVGGGAGGAARWNVYLPITVKVYGPALVAAALLPAGSVLAAADLAQAEVDLAEETSPAVLDSKSLVGRTLARAMKPGQTLREGDLRTRQWFAAGETVKLTATGNGFSVAGEGLALGHGIEGQPVRVRIEGGRTVSGQPVGDHHVEIAL